MAIFTEIILRKPRPGYFSIEGLFNTVFLHYPADIAAVNRVCPYISGGFLPRIGNLLWVMGLQGTVQHVTGDVHYLLLGMRPGSAVLTIHDAAVLKRLSGWKKKIYGLIWFQWPMARAAVVTVISQATRDHLLAEFKVPAEKIRVIPNCVSERFEFSPEREWPEVPRLLQIGTKKNKNILRVAEALRGLKCHLRIIGQPDRSQIDAIEGAGVAWSHAFNLSAEELAAEYRECDAVVFASTIEGFGLPILEAQATGRPVITSNCSSMPEVAGEGACFVDPMDIASIRQGILKVLGEPHFRQQLIAAGLQNVARYKPAAIAARYAEVYREVAEKQSGRKS